MTATLAIYRRAFTRAAETAVKNWPVAGSLLVYLAALLFAAPLLAPLGIAGGLLMSFLWSACLGSFLALVEAMVRDGRVTLADFRASFGRYLWDVVGISFVFWVFWTIATPALVSLPNGVAVVLAVQLVIFVLFNAVPELIYLGHHSSLELLTESYAFISENWIEWFPPNLLLVLGFWALRQFSPDGPSSYALAALAALYVYFAMAVRGFLFQELAGSTRRSRAFRHRMGQ